MYKGFAAAIILLAIAVAMMTDQHPQEAAPPAPAEAEAAPASPPPPPSALAQPMPSPTPDQSLPDMNAAAAPSLVLDTPQDMGDASPPPAEGERAGDPILSDSREYDGEPPTGG